MDEVNKNNPVKQLFNTSKSILIVLPPNPTFDMVSAGMGLHQSLKSVGKVSQIGCEIYDSEFNITGQEQIKDSIGNKNLHIIFNYLEENLEKVDYETSSEGKFSLVIKPKNGAPVPDSSGVKYSYSGADADLVVVFGVSTLEELGKIYAEEKKYLDEAKILSLNNVGVEATFTSNMLHQTGVSFSELVTLLLQRAEISLSPEASSNLLASIYRTTSNLTSPKMTADTFSTIATLMKNGGSLPLQQNYSKPTFFGAPQFTINPPIQPETSYNSHNASPIDESVPGDWKTPKIFRANAQ